MSNIYTNCQNCVFAKTENAVQVDCSMARSVLLGIEEIRDDGYFTLKRFCNTHRPEEWLQTLDLEEALTPEITALQEVFPRIGFFVRLETNDDDAIAALEKTIQSIRQVKGGDPAYVAVITDKVEYNEETWLTLVKHFDETDTKYHIVQLQARPKEVITTLDEAFTHAQNGWIYSTTAGESVASDTLTKLHELVNIQMIQLMMVEPYDDFNGLIFPAYLFKFLNGNKAKLFQDEQLDSRSFRDKVRAAEKRGNTQTVLTWKEFNAA